MNITDLLKNEEKDLCVIRKLRKGETLFREDDRCNEVGIILEGQVAIISYLQDGTEMVYNRLKKDSIFGNNLIFSSDPYYKGNIIAETDCQIAIIHKEELTSILKENQSFMIEYLRIQSDQGKQLNSRIRLLSQDSAEARFFCYMHDHHEEISYSSVSNLSKDLYISREALSRLLSRLEKEKKIYRDRKGIRLL